jgi:type IV secretion system protein TrbI
MADTPLAPTPAVPARVTDRRIVPAGVVPRHLQQWVVIGIAVVMVAILALSGPPAPVRSASPSSAAAVTVDPNQQRIEDFQRRIQEQAQRLAAEQAQLQLTKDTLAAPAGAPTVSATSGPVGEPGVAPPAASAARDTRDERARFADNVAFSRAAQADREATHDEATLPPALPLLPTVPVSGGAPPATPVSTPAVSAESSPTPARGPSSSLPSAGPRYRLSEGTVIDTVLTNRLDSTFTGPVNSLVSIPVYAADRVVIPAGARVLGEARAVNAFGQTRLAVVFHRILLPSGGRIDLDAFPALNQVGDLGLHDQVDRHYGQIFGVSIALGLIAGFAQGQTAIGLDATAVDSYRQGVASNVTQSSTRVLERFLNLLPTVTIREGHRIKVYLSRDLDLPAYPPALAVEGARP